MASPCGCSGGLCSCSIEGADGIVVQGNGNPGTPYVISAPETVSCTGQGTEIDASGCIAADISTDDPNALQFGTDGGLHVPPGNFDCSALRTCQLPQTRLFHSASQNIPGGTDFQLTFNTTVYDVGSMHPAPGPNIEIPEDGVYSLFAGTGWFGGTNQWTQIRVNAVIVGYVQHLAGQHSLYTEWACSAGDIVTCWVRTDSAGAVASLPSFSPVFGAGWLRP